MGQGCCRDVTTRPAGRPRQNSQVRQGWHARAAQAEQRHGLGTELRSWHAKLLPRMPWRRRAGPFGNQAASQVREGFPDRRSGACTTLPSGEACSHRGGTTHLNGLRPFVCALQWVPLHGHLSATQTEEQGPRRPWQE